VKNIAMITLVLVVVFACVAYASGNIRMTLQKNDGEKSQVFINAYTEIDCEQCFMNEEARIEGTIELFRKGSTTPDRTLPFEKELQVLTRRMNQDVTEIYKSECGAGYRKVVIRLTLFAVDVRDRETVKILRQPVEGTFELPDCR
jgi:hypothetical protein